MKEVFKQSKEFKKFLDDTIGEMKRRFFNKAIEEEPKELATKIVYGWNHPMRNAGPDLETPLNCDGTIKKQ